MQDKSKKCVFCGRNPIEKDREHVLGEWLIKHTGDPDRVVKFGVNFKTGKEISFAFDQLVAPSCKSCNNSYSAFEIEAKRIVLKLEAHESLTANESYHLLDWFDKVRVGLWLLKIMIQKNPLGIRPNFHIDDRIAQHDRYLAIYFTDGNERGLSFWGPENIVYHSVPSCFCLRVNSLMFVSVSRPFLLSRRLGFPYAINTVQRKSGHFAFDSMASEDRPSTPLIPKLNCLPSLAIGQIIFDSGYVNYANERYLDLAGLIRDADAEKFSFANQWVNFGANTRIQSKIFQEHLSHIGVFDNEEHIEKILSGNDSHSRNQREIYAQVYRIMIDILGACIKDRYEDEIMRRFYVNLYNSNRKYIGDLVSNLESEGKKVRKAKANQ